MKEIAIINTFAMSPPPGRYSNFENNFGIWGEQVHPCYFHYPVLDNPNLYAKVMAMDGVIISGSYFSISEPTVQYLLRNTLRLIKEFQKPLLGVCFGHQMIGVAFGFTVDYLDAVHYELEYEVPVLLQISPNFKLYPGKFLNVWESHHQEIKYDPKIEDEFEILSSTAISKVQILQHRHRPLFGLQFHPETPDDPRCYRDGKKILESFLALL